MNHAVPVLTLLCGFLLGVLAGPWLWPHGLMPSPAPESATPPPVAVRPPPPPPPPPPQPEPELRLKGVFVAPDPSRSRALIAQGDENARTYKMDDKLPDGSVLKAVNSKDIEVEKNGETRSLALERGTPGNTAEEEAPSEYSPAETATSPAATEVTPVDTTATDDKATPPLEEIGPGPTADTAAVPESPPETE